MTDSVNKKPKFVKSVWRGFGESGIQRNISSFNKEYECGLIGPAKIFDRFLSIKPICSNSALPANCKGGRRKIAKVEEKVCAPQERQRFRKSGIETLV